MLFLSSTSMCSVTPIPTFLLLFLDVYAFLPRGFSRALTLQPSLPPRTPGSILPPLHPIHTSAAAVVCLVAWPMSSHHICSFLIKYKVVFHSCHLHCCSFQVSVCYPNQMFFAFAPYVSHSSFCIYYSAPHLYLNMLLS